MTANAKTKAYHYDLMERNRETIKEQAALLNRNMETLRAVAKSIPPRSFGEPTEEVQAAVVCLPAFNEIDQRLKQALESVEEERASSRMRLPPRVA